MTKTAGLKTKTKTTGLKIQTKIGGLETKTKTGGFDRDQDQEQDRRARDQEQDQDRKVLDRDQDHFFIIFSSSLICSNHPVLFCVIYAMLRTIIFFLSYMIVAHPRCLIWDRGLIGLCDGCPSSSSLLSTAKYIIFLMSRLLR